jgi:hypothetical protein
MREYTKTGMAALAAMTMMAMPAAAPAGHLVDCTIDFEGACPNGGAVCGASFSGGGGCQFQALADCYSSGLRSYQVTDASPVTVTLSGSLIRLEVFFAAEGPTFSGEMRFFDATVGGNEVGSPLTTNGNCLANEPQKQTISFLAGVRRIEATSTGGEVWIDDFRTNPPNPCPTDTNDDGTTNVDDLVNIIVTWGTPGGVADVNEDGVVSVDDLVDVITFWGDC